VVPTLVPVFRPLLPSAQEILPYLERIDQTRWYTNFGPLLDEFEQRLATHFDVDASCIATAANGTLALMASVATATPARGQDVPIPAWTFPATALAVLGTGLRPYLCDIEEESWVIDVANIPPAVIRRSRALMPVAPFGAVPRFDSWMACAEHSGIPLIVDAAASFDQLASVGVPFGAPTMVMVSLHATKALGVGEGAVVVSNDPAWIERFRQYINFGFSGTRRSDAPGINAKLSEYAAAVGLAALDGWAQARRQWVQTTAVFAKGLRALELRAQPGFGNGEISPYCVAEFASREICDRAIAVLAADGIESRRWWGLGLHTNPSLSDLPRGHLTRTDDISGRTIGLPFWRDIGSETTERVFTALLKAV